MRGAHTIDAQIRCVQREIKMRERVYPRWVEDQRMNKHHAAFEIDCMKAVLRTLMEAAQGAPPKVTRGR